MCVMFVVNMFYVQHFNCRTLQRDLCASAMIFWVLVWVCSLGRFILDMLGICPKIAATADGRKCHVCGWDTDEMNDALPRMNDALYIMWCLHILSLSTRAGAFVHQIIWKIRSCGGLGQMMNSPSSSTPASLTSQIPWRRFWKSI